MAANDWMLQFLADILNAPVDRPRVVETTAMGAAYLAGLAAGISPRPDQFGTLWERERTFTPAMNAEARTRKIKGWHDIVARVLQRQLP
jgi:glycerol kinase